MLPHPFRFSSQNVVIDSVTEDAGPLEGDAVSLGK